MIQIEEKEFMKLLTEVIKEHELCIEKLEEGVKLGNEPSQLLIHRGILIEHVETLQSNYDFMMRYKIYKEVGIELIFFLDETQGLPVLMRKAKWDRMMGAEDRGGANNLFA